MGLVTKSYTFSAGATIIAAEHNSDFDTLYTLVNGNIDNNNVKLNAGIVDSKLAQITTAAKVSGTALANLASVPSGAGVLPNVNLLFAPRTAASDPQDATPGNRPAATLKEIVYYSGKLYFCTNSSTPTFDKITSG
jgi:hypothetical protein